MNSLEAASAWIAGLLTGPITGSLMAIAIALIGYEMLTGRLSILKGMRVICGCFILVSSATIAQSLMGITSRTPYAIEPQPAIGSTQRSLTPATNPPVQSGNPFDPYSGSNSTD